MRFWKRRATQPAGDPPRICSSCSSDVQAGAAYCTICGSLVLESTTRAPRARARPTFGDRFNGLANNVNKEPRGLFGPEDYPRRDGDS